MRWKSLSHVWLFVTSWTIQSGKFSRPEYWSWVDFPFFRGSSQPRDWTQISHIAGRFFTSWTTGKPKNTGVGSLSLLQGIFLTKELNWSLLCCRQILYQLSYQWSPLSPGICSDLCPLSWWCYLTISSSATPSPFAFSLPQDQNLFQ